MYRYKCPLCDANLDPGEKCDCGERKEADKAATLTTSSGFSNKKSLNNYTKESEKCQDVKSYAPGHNSDRDVRHQER